MAEKTINTVIVLRNDSTTAWESSAYQLKNGEVGVGYMTCEIKNDAGEVTGTKQVPVIKVGDGSSAWKDLPQAEGVFENDVTLTASFGKYTPTAAGFVKVPNSKGMTTTEFILDALSQVKEPEIKAPTFTLAATSLDTKEIGTTISSVAWTGTFNKGTYEYGSKKDTTTYTKADGTGQTATGYTVTCTPADGTGIVVGAVDQKEDGSAEFTTGYVVSKASSGTIATVQSTCAWSASDRTPLNNVGDETTGQLGASSSTKSVAYSVNGYREGFYYGTSTTKVTAADLTVDATLDDEAKAIAAAAISNRIRGLSKTAANYAAGAKTVSVPVGAASIILACPKANTGVTDVLNTTVNAGMNDAFGLASPIEVTVGGADATNSSVGNHAVVYNVWVYTPAEAYGSTASLTVTLG